MLTPKNFFLGLLATILLSSFFSCAKDLEGPAMQAKLLAPRPLAVSETHQPSISGRDEGCTYLPCLTAIEGVRLQYQQLANDLCDTVWMDITCCDDGTVAYTLTYVVPNAPSCLTETSATVVK